MKLSRLEQSLLLGSRGPFYHPENDNGNNESNDGKNSDDKGENNANSGGNEEFKPITSEAELSAYKADLRKNIAADLRKSIKAELDAERTSAEEAARKKKEVDDAAAKGEFETAKQKLTDDLSAAQTEVTTLKAENDQLREAMKNGLKAGWDELPEHVRKLGERMHSEENVLGRWEFLHDEATASLVKDLTEKNDSARGNGRDPKDGLGQKFTDEQKRQAQAVTLSRF